VVIRVECVVAVIPRSRCRSRRFRHGAAGIALEQRDNRPAARVVYVRRAFRNGRIKCPKTDGSVRAVPLQAIALEALDQPPVGQNTDLLFPSPRGTHLDLHNFRTREWKPAQLAAGIAPVRRVYDLRHTFATFALRAGISTFDLSRYIGTSLTMIERHYGHLARDGREHAIKLLDLHNRPRKTAQRPRRGRRVDVDEALRRRARQQKQRLSRD
jgi:integrase